MIDDKTGSKGAADAGFTLIEALIVLGILSLLSVIMVVSIDGSRRAGLTAQAESEAHENSRAVITILERDVRDAGSGIFTATYRRNNGGEVGELTGNQNPDDFNYGIDPTDLQGLMVPPLEVINGTDSQPASYLNPVESTIGLTNDYRVANTDMITTYTVCDSVFQGRIDNYEGLAQENFIVTDPVLGARLKSYFDSMGGNPILVMMIDDEGSYTTLRAVTGVVLVASEYLIKMEPSQSVNQPSNFKGFLEDIGYRFNVPGGPELLRNTITGDNFAQVSAATYFVYSHPDPQYQASGWLVRLDLPAIVAGSLSIDATDPNTIRPFVVAERVEDFQVALGIDFDDSGVVDAGEWRNAEDMENYIHAVAGDGSVSTDFEEFINKLREVRMTVVSRTGNSVTENPYGFARHDSPNFDSIYPSVASMAEVIGVSGQIEDHAWSKTELQGRLWYHRAMQVARRIKIRNLDLANTFARTQ